MSIGESYNDSRMNSSRVSYRKQSLLVDKPKMLIANDTIPVLENLNLQFRNFFEVYTADNGYVALQKVKEQDNACYFDIILLDINMPISDGFDACEKIHQYID
jgi:CheY-like chemotaxis protein